MKIKDFSSGGIEFEIKKTFQKSICSNNMKSKLTTNFLKTQIQVSSKKKNLKSGHEGKKNKVWVNAQPSPYPLSQKGKNRNRAQEETAEIFFLTKPVY